MKRFAAMIPGNTYTFPILDGSDYFNEESADVWRISASEYTPKGEDEKFSSVSVSQGSDGVYYLTVKVKQNRDTYYSEQDAFILLKVEEKGIDREDAEINSSDATQYESDTRDFFDNLDDSGDYGAAVSAAHSSPRTVCTTPPSR